MSFLRKLMHYFFHELTVENVLVPEAFISLAPALYGLAQFSWFDLLMYTGAVVVVASTALYTPS